MKMFIFLILGFLAAGTAVAETPTVAPVRTLGGIVSPTPPQPPASSPNAPTANASPNTQSAGKPGAASSPPMAQGAKPASQPALAAQTADIPPSRSSIRQSTEQLEGIYPQMDRPAAGGQIQEAWDVSDHHDGVYSVKLCTDCVYKVRLREFMITTLALPDDAVISGSPDLGDAAGFEVAQKSPNKVAVRPKMAGVDTNLNIYTKAGRVYPFYLRSEGYNSINVPDILVKVTGQETPPPLAAYTGTFDDRKNSAKEKALDGLIGEAKAAQSAKGGDDFVRNIPFDPAKLHGWDAYKLWGDDELKPDMVFRDEQFTYLQWKNWDSRELPTAYVVVDGVDELVNTRVQGATFIIEAVNPLISLKSGKKFLCIQYSGATP